MNVAGTGEQAVRGRCHPGAEAPGACCIADRDDALKTKLGEADPRVTEARHRLAKLYDDWNKPEQAAQFR